ncbi:MAG: hypothetical protein M1827_004423 [Pycnora praestabilis]|nr:MAG: hypothetical protein M1827_004423 [Pycnora praestabilis]
MSSTQLGDLPEEILDSIISHLDITPRSVDSLNEEPSPDLISSEIQDLKSLSLISHSWRRLTLPWLFKYARLEVMADASVPFCNSIEAKSHVLSFIKFLKLQSLLQSVTSLFVYTLLRPREWSSEGGSSKQATEGQAGPFTMSWPLLLSSINPDSITILACPRLMSHLTGLTVDISCAWAFDMEYHIVRLQHLPRSNTSYPDQRTLKTNLFDYPWTHLFLNEGSFLKAYSTYEYFLKTTPSLIQGLSALARDKQPDVSTQGSIFSSLVSIQYTGIFPFYNHTGDIITLAENCPNLEQLMVQLAPSAGSGIMDDKNRMVKADTNDLWSEWDTSYSLIIHAVRHLGQSRKLKEFRCLDYAVTGYRDSLNGKFGDKLNTGWRNGGQGVWRRDKSLDVDGESDEGWV